MSAYERVLAAVSAIFFFTALVLFKDGEWLVGDPVHAILAVWICMAVGGLLGYMALRRHLYGKRS